MKSSRIWLPLILVVIGCSSPNELGQPVAPKLASKELTSFAFLKAHNPNLTKDYSLLFRQGRALVTLPTSTDLTTLKPSFSASPGATVTVGGVRQESGITATSFNSPVTYQVTAVDGSQQAFIVEVSVQQDLVAVDTDIQTFVTRYNLPGLSLAITKDERLVYAKGYGYANKEQKSLVTVRSQFRIASITKSITAITVLKLVEEGKLILDQTVFGVKGVLGNTYGTPPYKAGIEQITVRHLLQHTAGMSFPNYWDDPLHADHNNNFYSENTALSAIISNAVNRWQPVAAPGTKYKYSNFGYSILGRIIEKITGQSYEAYVKQAVLNRAGIEEMHIGKGLAQDKAVDEVTYYEAYPGRYEFKPYMFQIRRYDSAGGWIASASQLARLLVHADGFRVKEDLLSSALMNEMVTPSHASGNSYALGWGVNTQPNFYWHNGILEGTSTIWVRYANGLNLVILTNTYPSDDPTYWNSLFQLASDVVTKGNAIFMKGDQFLN
ncbi:beta-lactamase family protein [Nostoc sp. CHAB 5834]|nr:beta-lactamase family protein [Nostoc sp. CHAB 5834]